MVVKDPGTLSQDVWRQELFRPRHLKKVLFLPEERIPKIEQLAKQTEDQCPSHAEKDFRRMAEAYLQFLDKELSHRNAEEKEQTELLLGNLE